MYNFFGRAPNQMGAKVIWITGLSSAGKTTIGKALYNIWKKTEPALVLLDADELRNAFGGNIGYSIEDRIANGMRYSNLCSVLASQGINVILCAVAMNENLRQHNYCNLPNYKEVFLNTPMDILKQRNTKGLYNGFAKNVWGMDIIPEYPNNPDFEINNDGSKTPDEIAKIIARELCC
jgi:adenylylsulfate kinase-like enzyme